MNTDHEDYDSATAAFLHCKEFLDERDELAAAVCLEGLDCLEGPTSCRVAQRCLEEAQRHTQDTSARHTLALALNAVRRAIGEPMLLAAG